MPSLQGLAVTALLLALLSGGPAAAQLPGSPQPAAELTAPLPLEGTTWRLRQFDRRGVERTVGPEVAAWMTLRAGSLQGSGGCDRLRGRYGRMGEIIRIDVRDGAATDCEEQTSLAELAMVEGLREAFSFEITPAAASLDTTLILRDGEGVAVLRFEVDDIGSLTDETWLLMSYTVDGQTRPASTSQAAVLTFAADGGSRPRRQGQGTMVGSSGCNGIVGVYARNADLLRVRDLEVTPAPCPSGLAAQEEAILAVLESSAVNLELPPDRLVLTSTDTGEQLGFVTTTPLQGSTWLLAAIPGRPDTETPVTLRLEGGLVTGEGPCGPYRGRYATDGIFIRFGELSGSGVEGCPERKLQRGLLAALERTVLLDRDQPQLQFLDARGEVQARFRRPTGP